MNTQFWTDGELDKAWRDEVNVTPHGSVMTTPFLRRAMERLPEPTATATLKPISEMAENVPEGCVRLYWNMGEEFTRSRYECDTHAIDIQLPAKDGNGFWTWWKDVELPPTEDVAHDRDIALMAWQAALAQKEVAP